MVGRTKPAMRPGEDVVSTWIGRSVSGIRERSTAVSITNQRVLISTVNGVGDKTWLQFPYAAAIGLGGINGRADSCELSISCDGERVVLIGPRQELEQLLDALLDAIATYTPLPD